MPEHPILHVVWSDATTAPSTRELPQSVLSHHHASAYEEGRKEKRRGGEEKRDGERKRERRNAQHSSENSIPATVKSSPMHCSMQLSGVFVVLPACWSMKMRPSRLSLSSEGKEVRVSSVYAEEAARHPK